MLHSTSTKTCTQCGQSKLVTHENFHRDKRGRDGFGARCKDCRLADLRERYAASPEKYRERNRAQHQKNRDKRIEKSRAYYTNNREKLLSQKSEYGAKNRDALKVKGRKYRSENKAKLAEYEREYYAERPGKRAEKGRKYYADNHERVREYARKYYAEYRLKNLKKVRAADRLLSQRRRARKAHFPDTLTSEQWENCVAYFGGACAACGSGGDTTLDHWIPISNKDCPGTVAENTVCLCAACNTSKHDRGALEWATWKFGESKANEFMSKVQAYFDSLKA